MITKYLNEQGEAHGGNLHWPGLNGLPVRGSVGLLKDDELDEFFEVACDFHCREFDLADPEQLKAYTEVMDRIVNGWYTRLFVDNYRDPEKGTRKVYLEWQQSYGQISPRANTRIRHEGSAIKNVG